MTKKKNSVIGRKRSKYKESLSPTGISKRRGRDLIMSNKRTRNRLA